MTGNRFEQVDERQDDAITLGLSVQDGTPSGFVLCPAALLGGTAAEDRLSPVLPAVDAFRSAIRLANEIKAPIVVMDPDGLWQAEWGTLARVED